MTKTRSGKPPVYDDLPKSSAKKNLQQAASSSMGAAAATSALAGAIAGPGTPTTGGSPLAPGTAATSASSSTGGQVLTSPNGTTLVISKEAPKLRFQVRGGIRETLAETWDQLRKLTEAEWTEAANRIAAYEANGVEFSVDWKEVLPTAVREEAQFAHLMATEKEEESAQLFDGGLDATAVIERLRSILTNDDSAPSATTIEGRKREAANALIGFIRTTTEITPKLEGSVENIIVPMRKILEEKLPGQTSLHHEILKDRELAGKVEAYKEYIERLKREAIEPGYSHVMDKMRETAEAKLAEITARDATRTTMTFVEIAQAHGGAMREIRTAAAAFLSWIPGAWTTNTNPKSAEAESKAAINALYAGPLIPETRRIRKDPGWQMRALEERRAQQAQSYTTSRGRSPSRGKSPYLSLIHI